MTYQEAAATPHAVDCSHLQGLCNTGNIKPGQTLLINGAGGGVGTFAVRQLYDL
jgi:NADPH:quinone reductase-like Zn-dependent oxidoreductase